MSEIILASIPSPSWQGFELGPLHVRAYALCILLGIIVAVMWTDRRLHARGAEKGAVLDIAMWAVPLGIIGARVYHVLTHWGDYFAPGINPLTALYIWQGGIAIFGALIGGSIGAYFATRRMGIRFGAFLDAIVPGLMAAQALGRFGNYFNHELFGKPTDLPWGLQIESTNPAYPVGLPGGTLFHPTFLYEILWNVVGIILFLWLQKRLQPQWGTLFALYLIWYGIGRFWLEDLRIDPIDVVFGLRINQFAALLVALFGLILWYVIRRRHPGKEPSVFLPSHVSTIGLPQRAGDEASDESVDTATTSR